MISQLGRIYPQQSQIYPTQNICYVYMSTGQSSHHCLEQSQPENRCSTNSAWTWKFVDKLLLRGVGSSSDVVEKKLNMMELKGSSNFETLPCFIKKKNISEAIGKLRLQMFFQKITGTNRKCIY